MSARHICGTLGDLFANQGWCAVSRDKRYTRVAIKRTRLLAKLMGTELRRAIFAARLRTIKY
jgi:hypothetical protein